MRRTIAIWFCMSLFCSPFIGTSQGDAPSSLLTEEDVLQMIADGISAEIVVAKIKSSDCAGFDTSPSGLQTLKGKNVPDSVILAMVEAKCRNDNSAARSAITDERAKFLKECPECKGVIISQVDPQTGVVTDNWVSENQRKYLEERRKKISQNKAKRKLFGVQNRASADYIILWTAAQGFRPYMYYVPRTETETHTVTGGYSTYGSAGQSQGTFSGTVNVEKQYYQQQSGQWPFVDVLLQVYDARTSQKIFETHHQGNWRWSKPDKDCLDEALKFLTK